MKEVESFVCLFPLLKSLERKERDGWTDITPQYISGGGTAHYYGTLRISRFTYNATAGREAATAARAIKIKFGLIMPSFCSLYYLWAKTKGIQRGTDKNLLLTRASKMLVHCADMRYTLFYFFAAATAFPAAFIHLLKASFSFFDFFFAFPIQFGHMRMRSLVSLPPFFVCAAHQTVKAQEDRRRRHCRSTFSPMRKRGRTQKK